MSQFILDLKKYYKVKKRKWKNNNRLKRNTRRINKFNLYKNTTNM